jgi:hypothetical protein
MTPQESSYPNTSETKTCTRCGLLKSTSEFRIVKDNKTIRSRSNCKSCEREMYKIYRENNPEKVRSAVYRWRDNNRDAVRELQRAHYERHPEAIRRGNLLKYGMSLDDFDTMLASQGNKCAICKSEKHNSKNWMIDHDHETGEIRGILCHGCNIGLGGFRDNPDSLMSAVDYLNTVRNRNPIKMKGYYGSRKNRKRKKVLPQSPVGMLVHCSTKSSTGLKRS